MNAQVLYIGLLFTLFVVPVLYVLLKPRPRTA